MQRLSEELGKLSKAEIETLFKQILDAVPDMVLLKAPGSRLVWANAAFRAAYGMSKEHFQHVVDSPYYRAEYTRQYVEADANVFNEHQTIVIPSEPLTRADGEVLRVHTTKSPIYDEQGRAVLLVAVCHDLAERHRLEAQLRLADRMASVGTLAAGIAHEINTPIQFVNDSVHFLRQAADDLLDCLGHVETLRHRLGDATAAPGLDAAASALVESADTIDLADLAEHIPKAFARCQDGLDRVSAIVKAMRVFAHPGNDVMAPSDLNQAIQSTLTIARNEYRFVADLATAFGELPPVHCLIGDINQVVLNLIVNSAHSIAQRNAGSERRGLIDIRTRCDATHAVVTIADDGIGIAPEIAPRVFEMFFTTKEVGKGTGQGLAMAWSVITEKHGGAIGFENNARGGATFTIRLPIAGRCAPCAPDGTRPCP
jgi:two-component system NtrC family sensor kinase